MKPRLVSLNLSSLKDVKICHTLSFRRSLHGRGGPIANRFGPAVGGLFLAFPAIFPAGASLLEAHEKRKMAKSGLDGTKQGREAASVDSAGASTGCIGLIAFAVTISVALQSHNAYLVIALGTLIWLVVSVALWLARKSWLFRGRT